MYYWENNDDKLYMDSYWLEPGYPIFDSSQENEYIVLTSQYDILSTSTQITVSGKSGTYTYGGYDSERGENYWENSGDKLYYWGNHLEPGYNIHDSEWNEYIVLTSQYEKTEAFVSVVSGDVVQFRGNNAIYNGNCFSSTCNFNVEGNIMSLIDSNGYATATTLSSAYTFTLLFQYCTGLTSAKNFILPATTLSEGCYSAVFAGCTSLTTAPYILPATTLAFQCYSEMFSYCTSLTSAPELPATTLANRCYSNMFNYCASLTTAPELPATTLVERCYEYMFQDCTSLTTAPELPATTLANNCYYYMFQSCTSLTIAPELPATTLAGSCYWGMFHSCRSLTTAPELPATTLASQCYQYMFNNCTSLTTAPELPATTLSTYCYSNMFDYCTSLTTAPELPATTLANYCYNYMFDYCTSLTTAPSILPATTLAWGCYDGMFNKCTSLTSAPELPATTLTSNCYSFMFQSCTNLNYIKCLATNISVYGCTYNWVDDVASTGTFVKASGMSGWTIGTNGIPSGWTIQNAS